MLVPEDKLPWGSATVVFFPADQNTEESTLSSTLTSKYGYLDIQFDTLNLWVTDLSFWNIAIDAFLHLINL